MILRALAISAVFAITIFVVAFGVGLYVRRNGIFFPEPFPEGLWDTSAFSHKPVDEWFEAEDGIRLHGWLFRSDAADPPLMIWYHGNAGNITHRAAVADILAGRGIDVFLFDYRGFGKSEGSPTEKNVYLDAVAAWRHATSNIASEGSPVVLYGESIGGAYAAFVASKHPPRCVIIENSFASLHSIARVHYHPLPVGLLASDGLNTLEWLNQADVPVLVMHGKRDKVAPFELGIELYEGLDSPKDLFVSETADHSAIPWIEGKRYFDRVTRFVEENTQPAILAETGVRSAD